MSSPSRSGPPGSRSSSNVAALSVDELVANARAELDSDAVPNLLELHRRGTREIFDRACALCGSSPDDRVLGLRILRELGGSPPVFAADAVPFLLGMLATERAPRVLSWTISALGYQHMSGVRDRLAPTPAVLSAVLAFATHREASVRFALANALPCLIDEDNPEPSAIEALVGLSSDEDADTRYYAFAALTDDFSLTHLPGVRRALEECVGDPDAQIRTCAARVLAGGTWSE